MDKLIELPKATCRSVEYTEGLKELINHLDTDIKVMVEIGSYQGESTAIFAKNITTLEKLYAVDPWQNGYDEKDVCSEEYDMSIVESNFDIRTKEYDVINKMKMTSLEFVDSIEDGSLDFVYIDGLHTYDTCNTDIQNWISKVKKGGYIGGHDYLYRCFKGVVRAVDENFGKPDITFKDTSWLVKIQ